MENIDVAVDSKTVNGFKTVHVEFGFPGCGCPIVIETAPQDTDMSEEELVVMVLQNAETAMRKNPFCPHCGVNWRTGGRPS